EIAAIWRQTDELFERIKREARRFVSTLREAARTSSPEISAYLTYRDAVTVYVEAFEHDLDRVTRQVRGYFQAWTDNGFEARLLLDLPSAEGAAQLVGVVFQLGQTPTVPRSLAEVDDDWADPWSPGEPLVPVVLSDLTRRQPAVPFVARPIARSDGQRAQRA